MRGVFRRGGVLIVVFAALWGGTQTLATYLANPEPAVVTCDEIVRSKPERSWLRIQGCGLDLPEATFFETTGRIREIYVPLRSPSSPRSGKIHVLVRTRDPRLLELAEQLQTLKSPKDIRRFLEENDEALYPQRDVEGLVQFGIELKDDTWRELQRVNEADLVADALVLREGAQPRLGFGLAMLSLGLALAGWLAFGLVRSLRRR